MLTHPVLRRRSQPEMQRFSVMWHKLIHFQFRLTGGCSDKVECMQTLVQTTTGLVTLRDGSTDKQIAAGTDAVAGNPAQTGSQVRYRPNSAPPLRLAGIGTGALVAIIGGIGAVVIAAIILSNDGNTDLGGGGVVVSPIR